ncbi:MAG: hypothetical protein ACYTBW_04760 [Planctomycetota bacterium]|jgi:hypothetical protein
MAAFGKAVTRDSVQITDRIETRIASFSGHGVSENCVLELIRVGVDS